MKKLARRFMSSRPVQAVARGVVAVGENKVVATGAAVLGGGMIASAQTDATIIATNAQTAFGVIAPITITIAGFRTLPKSPSRW